MTDAQTDKNLDDLMARRKSDFLATISHEMRTPMQSVFGFLELMLLENPDPKLKNMIDRAMISASGVLEMLDDILDVAKIDADKMVLDEFEVPLRTLINGVMEAMQPRLQDKNITLCDDIAENVPKLVLGDPKRLRQILINLTGNAIKFTPQGRITLRVTRAESGGNGGAFLKFEVIDTGIGLSIEAQKKLFQPFTQADQSTSRTYGGTGLGLSISSKLVQLMKGEMGVESVADHGSNFWFCIPLYEVTEDGENMGGAQDQPPAPLPDLTGLSILSIENHPRAAREIAATLQSLGAKVETTSSVSEARAMINYRPFDAVISEQELDDGRGIDFIRDLAERNTNTGLMIYTASIDPTLRQSLKTLGAAYLEKPASRRGLAQAVAQMAVAQTLTRPTAAADAPQTQKILIVEDNPSVIEIFKRQMDVLGIAADFAANGEEALGALETARYHLILTDLHMPKMDGYGLIREIRALEKTAEKTSEKTQKNQAAPQLSPPPHQPVILLTADLQLSNYRAYMPLGFDECVIKPVTLGTMRQLFLRWGVALRSGAETKMTDPKMSEARPTARHEIFDKIDLTAPQDDVAFDGDQKTGNMAESAAIDMAVLAEQMGALDDGALAVLRQFPALMRPVLDQILNAAETGNMAELAGAAHSLKGAARSAGAMILGDLAAQIQRIAESPAPLSTETPPALTSALITSLARAFDDVESQINGMVR